MIKILKDSTNNDVLIINTKVINLHQNNTNKEYQNIVINNCQSDYEYEAYNIKDNLYVIKQIDNHHNYQECLYKIISNNDIELCETIETPSKTTFLSYNSKYITIVEREYDYPINEVLAAYDIEKQKKIDCSEYNVRKELNESVVKYKRCLYDVVASILTNQILMIDRYRLFNFMSFVTNQIVKEDNYLEYMPKVKQYILKNYPGLKNHNVNTDKKIILQLNEIFGIDYFKFKKIPYSINNLKYIQDKQLIK